MMTWQNIEPELICRVGAGDESALSELYDRSAPLLLATAMRILGDNREAEDVIQEVFVQIWGKSSSFSDACGTPLSWLLALTRNKSIDRLRCEQKRAELLKKLNGFSEAQNDTARHRAIRRGHRHECFDASRDGRFDPGSTRRD